MIKYVIPAVMSFIIVYYVVTSITDSFAQTAGGVVLMIGLLVGAVLTMGVIRRGGGPTDADAALGDD